MTLLDWVKQTLVNDVRFVEASITRDEWDELVREGYQVSQSDNPDTVGVIGVICVIIRQGTT